MKFTRVRIDNFYNLKDVDLDLTQGQALIVGPNGSGKSNIIKCIEFLVDRMLGRDTPSGDIRDVNAADTSIKVSAVFSREELELFSNVRVFYLLCDVCEMMRFIFAIVKSLVTSTTFRTKSASGSPKQLAKELRSSKKFRGFPKITLTSLFKGGFFGKRNEQGRFVVDANYRCETNCSDPCVESHILKTVEELFPKLLEKTQQAMASEQTRPADRRSDLFMSVRNADVGAGDELQSCCNMYESP